jgi:hypothetical protein
MVRAGVYGFRAMPAGPSRDLLERLITQEQAKPASAQGPRTFARELRRTLYDMGWLNENVQVTPRGYDLLGSEPGSIDEQALLVEGLLRIEVSYPDGTHAHHPVRALLSLLAHNSSQRRFGLELALVPGWPLLPDSLSRRTGFIRFPRTAGASWVGRPFRPSGVSRDAVDDAPQLGV